jgi:hypothetical protein
MTGMFYLKLLINLAPLSIAGQIDWHTPKVTIVWSGGALPKPGEKLGIRSVRPLPPALIIVSSALIFGVDTNISVANFRSAVTEQHVKHVQLVTRGSKDNGITHSIVTQGLHIFCDQALALYTNSKTSKQRPACMKSVFVASR